MYSAKFILLFPVCQLWGQSSVSSNCLHCEETLMQFYDPKASALLFDCLRNGPVVSVPKHFHYSSDYSEGKMQSDERIARHTTVKCRPSVFNWIQSAPVVLACSLCELLLEMLGQTLSNEDASKRTLFWQNTAFGCDACWLFFFKFNICNADSVCPKKKKRNFSQRERIVSVFLFVRSWRTIVEPEADLIKTTVLSQHIH